MRKKPIRTWKHTRFRRYELPGILLLLFLILLVMFYRIYRQRQYVPLSLEAVFPVELQQWYTDSSQSDVPVRKVSEKMEEWMPLINKAQSSLKEIPGEGMVSKGAEWGRDKTGELKSRPPIEVNTADSADFLPLYGIGPVYSGRIVKYRNLLGGFYCLDQLSEVYGLDTAVVRKNRDRLCVDTMAIRRINVNTADWGELVRHPYINKNQANDLLALRKHLGGEISTLRQLRSERIFSGEEYARICYYLDTGMNELGKRP